MTVAASGGGCGPEVGGGGGGGAVCSTRIYPTAVIKSIRQQMKTLTIDPTIPIVVPERMSLDERMKTANWKDAAMVELLIQDRDVHEVDVLRSREMVQRHAGTYGSIAFVALTLSVLAALYGDSRLEGYNLFGIVKETGIDDEGLAEFSNRYFGRYPLYCDKTYSLYQALGDRKAVELPSLLTLLTSFWDAWRRVASKGIGWNAKGEGIVKGGLIIFDTKGNPKYVYKEETGIDLPVHDIVLALEAVRRESKQAEKEKIISVDQSKRTETTT